MNDGKNKLLERRMTLIMRRAGLLAVLSVALVASGACYRYVETSPAALAPGSDVRVQVTRERAIELEEFLDQDDPREFEGEVISDAPPEAIRLSVPFQGVEAGSARRGFNTFVDIPLGDFEGIQLREFDWLRTGGLVGASALVAAAVIEAFFDPFDGDEGGDPGDIDAAILTLFEIRW
jgi:hypothetical protein